MSKADLILKKTRLENARLAFSLGLIDIFKYLEMVRSIELEFDSL
jgi:hypothetical protein